MMEKLTRIQALPDWRLEVRFSDGTSGVISIKERLFGPVFEPLKDPEFFAQASIDEFGAICWPNGADLAPDAIYMEIQKQAHVA